MPSKIFWKDSDKAIIVEAAVKLQKEDPSLSGLSLLRAATKELPDVKRRRLVSLRQAPWFERDLALSVKARKADEVKELVVVRHAANKDDPYMPIMAANADANQHASETLERLLEIQQSIRVENRTAQAHLAAILAEILVQLTRLREHCETSSEKREKQTWQPRKT